MATTRHPDDVSAIGRQLLEQFKIYPIEILREDYSATIDWGSEMSGAMKAQLERTGFDVIHEESTIYTLRYEYET